MFSEENYFFVIHQTRLQLELFTTFGFKYLSLKLTLIYSINHHAIALFTVQYPLQITFAFFFRSIDCHSVVQPVECLDVCVQGSWVSSCVPSHICAKNIYASTLENIIQGIGGATARCKRCWNLAIFERAQHNWVIWRNTLISLYSRHVQEKLQLCHNTC